MYSYSEFGSNKTDSVCSGNLFKSILLVKNLVKIQEQYLLIAAKVLCKGFQSDILLSLKKRFKSPLKTEIRLFAAPTFFINVNTSDSNFNAQTKLAVLRKQ